MMNATTELEKLTVPFWHLDKMYDESTLMIRRDDGTITAKLLYCSKRIISVYDYQHKVLYVDGKDYTWDGASSLLVWKEGSAIPYFTRNDIEGRTEDGTYIGNQFGSEDELGPARFQNAMCCFSAFLYEKHIQVTYEYEESWYGPVPVFQGDRLPRTMEILKQKKLLNLAFFGNSIFDGCDSSKMHKREPFQDGFPEQTAENIQKIMDTVRETSPNCEFLIVTATVPNKESGLLQSHPFHRAALGALAGPGVAFLDMYSFLEALLERKDFVSMSENNINHPNDWLIRCYAMNILSVLIP